MEEAKDIVDSVSSASALRFVVGRDSVAQRAGKLVSKVERLKGVFVLCLQLQSKSVSSLVYSDPFSCWLIDLSVPI